MTDNENNALHEALSTNTAALQQVVTALQQNTAALQQIVTAGDDQKMRSAPDAQAAAKSKTPKTTHDEDEQVAAFDQSAEKEALLEKRYEKYLARMDEIERLRRAVASPERMAALPDQVRGELFDDLKQQHKGLSYSDIVADLDGLGAVMEELEKGEGK